MLLSASPRVSFGPISTPSTNRRFDISTKNQPNNHSSLPRISTSLHSTNNNHNCGTPWLETARRSRFIFELRTFLRVLFPAILSGTAAFLALPSLCFRVANFVTRTTLPGKIGMLSDTVQSFISLVGLLYSILVGQVFGFLYSQQEALYLSLFDEVTEAKSLLEQVALVSQGRSMYLTCLTSIARYVREDLLGGTMTLVPSNISNNNPSSSASGSKQQKAKKVRATPSVTPSILLSARPADDPLESILYLTSVGIPGNIYDTVRSLRQARSRRLGALQRKVPVIHLLMLWIMGITLILTFPVFVGVGEAAWAKGTLFPSTGYNFLTLQGILFGVATFAVVLTKMVLGELWRTKGGAYNVDSVLRVMVRGLECELDERMAEAKQTMKRSKG
ncbi:hypothetical protein HJC23_007054 [Cyclotella cryptica]|uniref:Uncharacterized protein n=1 Tax=Cyclotella cryptica TaxID=29204 RepID=A0ABD3P937_9STRA